MSLPEQGAKVATSIVDGIKQQPVCLALLVICAALIGFMFFDKIQDAEARKLLFDKIQCISRQP